jgi:hypothetical protein
VPITLLRHPKYDPGPPLILPRSTASWWPPVLIRLPPRSHLPRQRPDPRDDVDDVPRHLRGRLPARALGLRVGIRATFLAASLKQSTNQPGRSCGRVIDQVASVRSGGCLTALTTAPVLADFGDSSLEVWIGRDCSATQPTAKVPPRLSYRLRMALDVREGTGRSQ